MRSFQDHLDTTILSESIDSPLEFYMTDDTIMPKQIYASVSVNGSDYGMSLVESTYDKVYVLELYRIVNVKRRTWSFKTPSDIRPVLSTLLKFVEASYPFIKNRMSGIIIDIPGKTGSEKYEKLLSRILRKTYIQTFRVVPVKKTTDKAQNYIFVVKKSVTPESIFKTATFSKHFDFDPKELSLPEIVTSENLEKMVVPYRTQKVNVTLTPSKRYEFKKLEIANTIDSDDIKLIDDVAEKAKKSGGSANVIDLLKPTEVVGEKVEEKPVMKVSLKYNIGDSISEDNFPIALLIARYNSWLFSQRIKNLNESEKKTENEPLVKELKSVMKSLFLYYLNTKMRPFIVETGLVNEKGLVKLNSKTKQTWEVILNDVWKIMNSDQFQNVSDEFEQVYKGIRQKTNAGYQQAQEPVLQYAKTLELPVQLQSTNPAFQKDNDSKWSDGDLGFELSYSEDNINAKLDAIKTPKYESWSDSMRNLRLEFKNDYSLYSNSETDGNPDVRGFIAMESYTSNGYTVMNPNLRKSISIKKDQEYKIGNQTKTLIDFYLKYGFALEDDVWVYRNASVPGQEKYEPGDTFIDPAFLSTSIYSKVSFNSKDDSTRLKIFVPKGTKCLPVLEFSNVKDEHEIILPPFSRIKLTEVYKVKRPYTGSIKPYLVGVYTGNGLESFYESYKENKVTELFESQVKNGRFIKDDGSKKETNPIKNPSGSNIGQDVLISYAEMQGLAKNIASGKIKIKS
jgi:hypothetical protein